MAFKVSTPHLHIKSEVMSMAEERARKVAVNVLNYAGNEAIEEARDHGDYTDQTGNLRSSIGYVVTDGTTISSSNNKVYKGGHEGAEKANGLLKKYAEQHHDDIELHLVAGMEYAGYVERIHHKNVLSSARILLDDIVPKRLEESGLTVKKISKR